MSSKKIPKAKRRDSYAVVLYYGGRVGPRWKNRKVLGSDLLRHEASDRADYADAVIVALGAEDACLVEVEDLEP